MVGGTIADLFRAEDRGLGMNLFSLMVFIGQALGGIVGGYVGMYWGIQWCYGVSLSLISRTETTVLIRNRCKESPRSCRAYSTRWYCEKLEATCSSLGEPKS
jgi:predicted MFS family arabinose efflux permease